uniref:Reverse transcriptase RNase H-like domain-containing protein n=1 Tax=Timema poppense TaxID=170557 RepID=A0A7R9D720_TIMPO|nr:unnamed protein product [Timema poppensis]
MALSWMWRHPKQLGNIGRWVLRLSKYKFTTYHVPGRNNVTADALLWMMEDLEPIDTDNVAHPLDVIHSIPESFVSILEHQRNDPWCSEMMDKILNGDDVGPYSLHKVLIMASNGKGDSVLCKLYPQSSTADKISAKLSPKWSGPWRVERFLTPVTLLLMDSFFVPLSRWGDGPKKSSEVAAKLLGWLGWQADTEGLEVRSGQAGLGVDQPLRLSLLGAEDLYRGYKHLRRITSATHKSAITLTSFNRETSAAHGSSKHINTPLMLNKKNKTVSSESYVVWLSFPE